MMKREEKNGMASPRPRTIMSQITWEKSLMPMIQWWFSQLSFNRREHKSEWLQTLVNFIYGKLLSSPMSFHKSPVWKYVFMKEMLMLNAVELTALQKEEKRKNIQIWFHKRARLCTFSLTNFLNLPIITLSLQLFWHFHAKTNQVLALGNYIFSALSFDCFKHLAFPNLLALKLNIPNRLNTYFLTLKYL